MRILVYPNNSEWYMTESTIIRQIDVACLHVQLMSNG